MQDSKPNWPIVGGEYRWKKAGDGTWVSRVTSIEADYVYHQHVSEGKAYGRTHFVSLRSFRDGHIPEDQSPIPYLVAALKEVAERFHEGFPCFCDLPTGHEILSHEPWCLKARAALALAGETRRESETSKMFREARNADKH